MRVADYLMSRLAELGITHVFVLPGGGAMHLNDGLACEPRITPVPCHHEQACGIAAEAWGRIAGSFGVAMVTTGPGTTNIVTPVAGAWIESVPLMIISGQVKRPDLLAGRPLRQGGVQEVDIIPIVKSITKYAVTIMHAEDVKEHFERALHLMLTGRQGPVWLDIPLDIQAAQIEPGTLRRFVAEASAGASAGASVGAGDTPSNHALNKDLDNKIGDAVELLAGAKRPLILAGHGVRLAGAAREFLDLAERLGVPVVTTWNAMDLIPWEHPLCAGRPGVVALRAANFAVQNCDLLLSIGSRLDNIITAYNPRGFARAAKKIVVDIDIEEIDKLDMDIDLAVVSNAADFITGLHQRADASPRNDLQAWRTKCIDWKTRYALNEGKPLPESGAIGHFHFASALSDAAPADTLVSTGSSGLAVEAFYTVFRNKPGQRIFLTSGLGAMGYGLPAAIGACLANQRAPMIAVESDGSLQLNLQELATLRALQLPICLFIMNNGGYCSIRNTQRNYFAERFLGTGPEAGLWLPDLERVAAVYDLPFMRIEGVTDLSVAMQAALALPRPCLIDVRLMENETLAPKSAAMPQADGSMLSMPLEDMSPLLPLAQLQAEMLIPLLPQSFAVKR
ncbi:MAG: thiamine pyrophosphate-binding protein [Rhodocyclaceae bacterium]|nr:thiamine pyrophosphate-binding protein [Rhodocyclaceae bacterium]